VCSIYERHVDKANQQKSNTRPCWKEEYSIIPAAPEPVALVDVAPVRVVVPLDAVQECCSADQPDDVRRHQKEEDDASSRAANDTPQKHDSHPSPVQMNSKTASVPEAYSSRTCARKYRNGESF